MAKEVCYMAKERQDVYVKRGLLYGKKRSAIWQKRPDVYGKRGLMYMTKEQKRPDVCGKRGLMYMAKEASYMAKENPEPGREVSQSHPLAAKRTHSIVREHIL